MRSKNSTANTQLLVLLTGKGIDDNYVEYKPKKVKTEPEMSKADIRIIEDIHAMKDAQRKRLMK